MNQAIVGPVLADIEALGMKGPEVVLASAFYSGARLNQLSVVTDRLSLMVRLDLRSIESWVLGLIAPDALLAFVKRHQNTCGEVRLLASETAHTKVYWGAKGFLVGSANLTVRGLSGVGNELLWREAGRSEWSAMRQALEDYESRLREVDLVELAEFVRSNSAKVRVQKELLAKRKPRPDSSEDRLPAVEHVRPKRLGTYEDFLNWLARRRDDAATTIWARAHGEGQLSGHIRRNFYGIRQFLIASPAAMRGLVREDPLKYKLHQDPETQGLIRDFVLNEATDEEDLKVDTWRTYLPESAGGKPKTGGGSSGNVKRMLPLVARYLSGRLP